MWERCDSARSVGLQAVVAKRQLQLIVDVLEGDREVDPASWSARQRHYREKLKGGDLLELAAVIRAPVGEHQPPRTMRRVVRSRAHRPLTLETLKFEDYGY
jgi:RNA polymerase-interacting CarD/CdnL/TRCF family regulator